MGDESDRLLWLYIELVAENRPLFPNPLDEPIFFRRYLKRWIIEGLREYVKTERGGADKLVDVEEG